MLEEVGLDADESAVLVALLRGEAATPDDLAGAVDDAESVLASLCHRGLALGPDESGRYRPADPTLLTQTAVRNAEERVERLRELAVELRNLYRAGQSDQMPIEYVEYLPGNRASILRIYELMRSARQRISTLDRAPWNPGPGPDGRSAADVEFDAIGRGVEFRVIYERAAVDEPGRLEDVRMSVDRGEQARVLPSVPCLFYLIDDVAAIPITDSGRFGDGGLLVHGGPLLIALQGWYEALWAQAIPLDSLLAEPESTDFTAAERALIGLLASGLTDKAIARQLGVSDRTAQRRVAAVIQRLGAQTRFQAGLQASRKGLF